MNATAYSSENLPDDRQVLLPAHQVVAGPLCCQGCALRARRKARAKRFSRRACHFIGIFLITCWLGLHIFQGVIFAKFGGPNDEDGPIDFPIPSDLNIGKCAYWEDAPTRWSRFRSKTSFELPLDADKLFLLSQGLTSGDVQVEATDDDGDVAVVTVFAHYKYKDDLDWVKVCEVDRGNGEKGIGLFGPRFVHRPHQHDSHLSVILSLPRGGADRVLKVKNFETDLSLFAHHIHDLVGKVEFDSIKLRSANTPINVDSLKATLADAETINSPIEGRFDVTDELKLHTANSLIKVQANLYNADEGSDTKLDISTSNGPIKAEVNLYSTSTSTTGGSYAVSARTSMSPVEIIFDAAPVDSKLSLDAHTALGPATVKLHKTYEGTFEASSSMKRPEVRVDRDVEDPAGRGRKREVKVNSSGSTVRGTASWGGEAEGKEKGNVKVSTSLAGVVLVL